MSVLVVTPDPDDDDDPNDDVELTPEQRERMRKAFGKVRDARHPKFKLNLPDLTRLTNAQERLSKATALPESISKNLAAEVRRPVRDVQSQWLRQINVINSDALKSLSVMPRMDSVFARITKNAEFTDSVSRLAEQVARQYEATLKPIAQAAKRLSAAVYPSNLREIEDLEFVAVEEVVLADGIALYTLPRQEVAEALILADGTAERLAILDADWRLIIEDCRAALDLCESEYTADWVVAGQAALDAFGGGHETAAQALVGSLTDTVVNSYMGNERWRFTPDKKGTRTNDPYKTLGPRSLIALGPIWQAYQKFEAGKNHTIPTTFSRHATIHTVSKVQYTRRNLVQGLMLVCSLIYYVNERATSEEAA